MADSLLYLGVHEDEWNSLKSEVEDLLYDVTDGQHILGMYPFGDRILGLENAAPGILCLYLKNPLDLLNPSKGYGPAIRQSIGVGCGPVLYVDIFYWTMTLGQPVRGSQGNPFVHVIPCRHDILWQSPGIDKILEAADEFLKRSPVASWSDTIPVYPGSVYSEPNTTAATYRAMVLMYMMNSFNPCINPAWDSPAKLYQYTDCPDNIIETDNKLTSKQEISSEEIVEYINWLKGQLARISYIRKKDSTQILIANEYRETTGRECAAFLRTLL